MPLSRFLHRGHYLSILKFNYDKYFAPYRNVIACNSSPDERRFREWIGTLAGYDRVIVVAGGPSANKIPRSPDFLYVSTNHSYKLVRALPYIYFVSEGIGVYRYLKHGVPGALWQGTVIREEVRSGSPSVAEIAKKVAEYKHRYKRTKPEIFATDLHEEGVARENYDFLEEFVQNHLGVKFKQFNSGFGALQVAYCVAALLNLPLDIYGLDAGFGGAIHFDGTESRSKSVSGDRVREKLTELLKALYAQAEVQITNYSFFMGTAAV